MCEEVNSGNILKSNKTCLSKLWTKNGSAVYQIETL